VISADLEEMFTAFQNNATPSLWTRVAFLSLWTRVAFFVSSHKVEDIDLIILI
jgi:hypothetical protein